MQYLQLLQELLKSGLHCSILLHIQIGAMPHFQSAEWKHLLFSNRKLSIPFKREKINSKNCLLFPSTWIKQQLLFQILRGPQLGIAFRYPLKKKTSKMIYHCFSQRIFFLPRLKQLVTTYREGETMSLVISGSQR